MKQLHLILGGVLLLSLPAAAVTLAVTTSSVLPLTVATSYSFTMSATGGTPPYTWTVSSGSLPTGINISSGGVISGTPNSSYTPAGGYSTATIQVTDSVLATATQTFTFIVWPATDIYGGLTAAPSPGGATGYFRIERSTSRGHWLWVTPLGNYMQFRGVYNTDYGLNATVKTNKYANNSYTWASNVLHRMTANGFNVTEIYYQGVFMPIRWGYATGNPGGNSPNSVQVPFVAFLNSPNDVQTQWPTAGLDQPIKNATDETYQDSNGCQHCVSGAGTLDAYDPRWPTFNTWEVTNDLTTRSGSNGNGFGSAFATSPWVMSVGLGDATYLDSLTGNGNGSPQYPHVGEMVATANYLFNSSTYPNNKQFYSKFAWACGGTNQLACNGTSYLEGKYGSIMALNSAWGTGGFYTTFGSTGTWGTGTGVLDEDGRHSWFGSQPLDYFWPGGNPTNGMNANLQADLNAFLQQFTATAIGGMANAVRAIPDTNHIFECGSYGGVGNFGIRDAVTLGLAQYCNIIITNWNNNNPSGAAAVNQHEYNLSGVPQDVWYSVTANADSPYNPCPCGSCTDQAYDGAASQGARGTQYVSDTNTQWATAGADSYSFMMGTTWWGETDENCTEGTNWGLFTFLDNIYNGKEAAVATGVDAWGYPTGGQAANYGDFMDKAALQNLAIDQLIIHGGTSGSPSGGMSNGGMSNGGIK